MERERSSEFQCPGEALPISRSLHLARLARGYVACRECLHQHDRRGLPNKLGVMPPCSEKSLVTEEGLRGIWRNELTCQVLERWCEHLLSASLPSSADLLSRPRVLVGHDARASSTILMRTLVASCLKWGWDVADVAQVTRPCFEFALQHLAPDLGIFVTGGDKEPIWNGLDLLAPSGDPWNFARLKEIEARLHTSLPRPVRVAGEHHPQFPVTAYLDALRPEFHALRPLRIAICCPNDNVIAHLSELLEETPCLLRIIKVREPVAFAAEMISRHVDVGMFIRADGRQLQVFDECGEMWDVYATLMVLRSLGEEDVHQLGHAIGFVDPRPRCDAVLTIARLLRILSLSDRPASHVFSKTVIAG